MKGRDLFFGSTKMWISIVVSFYVAMLVSLSQNVTLLSISLLMIIMSYGFMHSQINLRLTRLTIPTFFWYMYIIMVFVPSIWLLTKNILDNIIFYCCVHIPLLVIPAGIFIANYVFKYKKYETEKFFISPIIQPNNVEIRILVLYILIATFITLIYFTEVSTIPLLYAIQNIGDYSNFYILREDSFKLLNSKFSYVYFILRQFGWAFIINCSFGLLITKKEKKFIILFGITTFLGIFFASASLIRGPAAVIFLTLVLYFYLLKNGRFNFITIILSLFIVLAVPIGILYLFSPDRGIISIVIGIFRRLLIVPSEITYYYFEIFPTIHDFLYGRSISKLASLGSIFSLNYNVFDLTNYVFKYIDPNSPISSGTAPAPFIGSAYADFGIIGVIIYSLLAGFIMQFLQIIIFRQKKDIFSLAMQALLMYSFWELNRTAFNTVLLSYGGLGVPLLYAFIKMFRTSKRSIPLYEK